LNVLGINAYHGDAAACIVVEGRLVAAVEEERFRRVKHWAGFPEASIRFCLEHAGIAPRDLDHVAIGRDPAAHLARKVLFTLRNRPSLSLLRDRGANRNRVKRIPEALAAALDIPASQLRARVHFVEHHRAHLASSFFASPFDRAACVSLDGFGDFVSTMVAIGEGATLRATRWVTFPHSLGAFYTAGTQHLGFERYGDEYKVMGLAAYGEPVELPAMREVILTLPDGGFRLNTAYFRHPHETVDIDWEGGAPLLGAYHSDAWARRFGPARPPDAPIDDRHRNLARSIQARTEEVFRHVLTHAVGAGSAENLCLAGGCAYNSVANGRVLDETPFARLFVPPAAGDAGTAVGAALWVWHQVLGRRREFQVESAALGPEYSDDRIRRALSDAKIDYEWIEDEEALLDVTAERIAQGEIVGWFQGRGEWGARALGYRSILADPGRPGVKEILNEGFKRREAVRPFAPAVPIENAGDYFERWQPAPFMTQTYAVRPERRAEIPAVTHVDGSARVQTVDRASQPLFHRLLRRFGDATGTPVLLNTSFNENEPIVHTPEEAADCFARTAMDVLIVGRAVARRRADRTGGHSARPDGTG